MRESGDRVTQLCCFLQTAARIEGKHAQRCTPRQSHIHAHRQHHPSIILVVGQSIYCWLTGIQSPFPTGPGRKNGRQPVKGPTLIVDWWANLGAVHEASYIVTNIPLRIFHVKRQKKGGLSLYSMYRLFVALYFYLPKLCVSLRCYFCHSTIKKPIRMWCEFGFCVSQADIIFLLFNAAKPSQCLTEMQKQLEVRAKYMDKKEKLYKDLKFKSWFNGGSNSMF